MSFPTAKVAGDVWTSADFNLLRDTLGGGEPVQPGHFIIYQSGSNTKRRNCLDGTTESSANATTVIQEALDALTYGGTLTFQTHSSTYASTIFNVGQLTLPDAAKTYGVRLCGDTQRMPTLTHTGTNESLIAVETPANDYYYIVLENLRFTSGATTGAFPIIDFDGVHQSRIINCQIQGQADQSNDGVRLGGGTTPGYYNLLFNNYLWRLNVAVDVDVGYNANRSMFTHVYDVNTAFDIDGGTFAAMFDSAEQVDTNGYLLGANATYPCIINPRLENTVAEGTAFNIVAGCIGAKIWGGSQSSFATPLTNAGTGTVVRDVMGLVTENSGASSIDSGTAFKVVAHGLGVTPAAEDFTIIGKENPFNDVGTIFVNNIGAVNFTVNVENDPGVTNWDFGWHVDASRR